MPKKPFNKIRVYILQAYKMPYEFHNINMLLMTTINTWYTSYTNYDGIELTTNNGKAVLSQNPQFVSYVTMTLVLLYTFMQKWK